MFEPLSALAVLGFATGTLGFIVSTISKLDERFQEVRECTSRLRSFSWQLEDAYIQLKVWHSIWIGKRAFPYETYVHFWGTDGLESVRSRVDGITELSNQIKSLLDQPVDNETRQTLPHSDLSDWHCLIDLQAMEPQSWRHADRNRAGLVRRVGFTLFRNTSLLEKISRLQNHIEGLREFTQCTFRLVQESDPNEKVTSAELRRISDTKLRFDHISNLGMFLYRSGRHPSGLPPPRIQWEMELGPPEAGYTQDLWLEVDSVYIDFVVRDTSPDVEPKAIRIRLHLKKQLADQRVHLSLMVRRVNEILLDCRRLERHSEYDEFFNLLELPKRRSRSLKQMLLENVFSEKHRKCFEVERADLVYGLGHWMVLLSNTPWLSSLCTCMIRCIHTADTCTHHSFLPCPIRFGWLPRCPHRKLADDRLRLLGVALAEIALAVPISASDQDRASFLVGDEITSCKRLSSMLREKFGRNTITKAVSYCLDPDSTKPKKTIGPKELELCCQNIVLPLQNYHRIIKKHSQSASGELLHSREHINRYYEENGDLVNTEQNGDETLTS